MKTEVEIESTEAEFRYRRKIPRQNRIYLVEFSFRRLITETEFRLMPHPVIRCLLNTYIVLSPFPEAVHFKLPDLNYSIL